MKKEELKEKYNASKVLLEGLYNKQEEIKKALDNISYKDIDLDNEEVYEQIKQQDKKLGTEKKRTETAILITVNNLINIQQELLDDCMNYFINSKYLDKNIGPKTKEKIQEELKEHVKNNYNIETYIYINSITKYNSETETEISVYFQDFYYNYELKQEKLKYNHQTKEKNLYYYNKIDYIDSPEETAKTYIKEHKKALEEIDALLVKIETIRNNNNKIAVGALNYDYYIKNYTNY